MFFLRVALILNSDTARTRSKFSLSTSRMENGEGEKFHGDYIPSKNFLMVVGIWPTNVNYFSSFVRFLLAVGLQVSCVCSLLVELYRRCTSVDDMMDAFILTASSAASVLKMLIFRIKSRHSRVLVDSVVKDWMTVRDARHERIMAVFFQRGKYVLLAFFVMCYMSASVFIMKFNAFDKPVKKQIMKVFGGTMKSLNDTPALNEISAATCVYGVMSWYQKICVIVMQAMQMSALICTQCGSGPWFFGLTMHLCGQFQILRMNLEEMRFDETDSRRKFGLLVDRHCRLVGLANDLEESFNLIILSQLCTSMLMICVQGFMCLLTLETGDIVGACKGMIFITTMFIQLYLFAYAADILESEAESIADAVYSSSWYILRGNAAKQLTLVIGRGHLSCHVTAGKFVTMNRFTFKETLKATASYMSVLREAIKISASYLSILRVIMKTQ